MYLVKTPRLLKRFFPNFVWSIPPGDQKAVYLTFDDGPDPIVTDWVLKTLKEWNAHATFFCLGNKVEKHPELVKQLRMEGHTVGNHSYSHPNGWETDYLQFFHNIRKGARLVNSDLFRPPYGKLLPGQSKFLLRHYRIIMWDVLSGDFDPNITAQECLKNVLKNAKDGSIIVFHDTARAFEKLEYVLPKILEYYTENNFRFNALSENKLLQRKTA